ncbi:hypothetical protein [Micromonospora sp. NPDC050200]|uniref:hypothetical protein n=1 Tax=Micromonospora sp. NPDC050200 TaxID=3155664 RepID=UPI0033DFC788
MTSVGLGMTAAPRPPGRALARTQFLLAGAYVAAVGVAAWVSPPATTLHTWLLD